MSDPPLSKRIRQALDEKAIFVTMAGTKKVVLGDDAPMLLAEAADEIDELWDLVEEWRLYALAWQKAYIEK